MSNQLKSAEQAEALRRAIDSGRYEVTPEAREALAAWDQQQQRAEQPEEVGGPPLQTNAQKALDARDQFLEDGLVKSTQNMFERVDTDTNPYWDGVVGGLAELTLDSEERLKVVKIAAETPVPMQVMRDGELVDTTFDERMEIRNQAMWDSLNPVQKAFISLGKGADDFYDIFGQEEVEENEEAIMDSLEKGYGYEAVELLGSLSQPVLLTSVPVGGIAGVTMAALKMAGRTALKGAGMKGLTAWLKYLAKAKANAGLETTAKAVNTVAKTKGGKAAIKAMSKTKSDDVGEQLVKVFTDKVKTVEAPIRRAAELQSRNPDIASKAAAARSAAIKKATRNIDKEAKAATERLRAQAAKRAAAIKKREAGDTIGLKGQSGRYQQAANKQAAKKSPGGY